jgi:hypothetical protein
VPIRKPAQSTNKIQNSTNKQDKTLKRNKYVEKKIERSTGAEFHYPDRK